MKKIWIVLGLIFILLLLGYLYHKGIIKVDWQVGSMILAALAGPYTFIEKHLKIKIPSKSDKLSQLLKQQKILEKQEQALRIQYEQKLKQKDIEIQQLQAQLYKLQQQLEDLRLQRQQIEQQVHSLSLEQKQQQFASYFGS